MDSEWLHNLWTLEGKTALVIGYAGNLGPIWVRTLNHVGAKTYAIGLPDPKETNQDIYQNHCDVTRRSDFEKFSHITPDVIVFNAGIDNPPDASEPDGGNILRNFKKIIEVNLIGPVNALDYFLDKMVANGGGSIHLIGSIMGYGPADESNYPTCSDGRIWTKPAGYNVSKKAYLALAQVITGHYGQHGIRCTVPAFGPIDMGQLSPEFMEKIACKIPMRQFTDIPNLQRTLLYNACCDNFAGQDTLVDGGYRER
jgi:NAD(P)-dependent dehydrogenase (short-subunit alcohol dehydrogenase family)